MTSAVLVEALQDGLGGKAYRVSRVFPSLASADAGVRALSQINPVAFEPVGLPAESQDLVIPEPHPLAVRQFDNATETDGEDAPCVGSVCRAE